MTAPATYTTPAQRERWRREDRAAGIPLCTRCDGLGFYDDGAGGCDPCTRCNTKGLEPEEDQG